MHVLHMDRKDDFCLWFIASLTILSFSLSQSENWCVRAWIRSRYCKFNLCGYLFDQIESKNAIISFAYIQVRASHWGENVSVWIGHRYVLQPKLLILRLSLSLSLQCVAHLKRSPAEILIKDVHTRALDRSVMHSNSHKWEIKFVAPSGVDAPNSLTGCEGGRGRDWTILDQKVYHYAIKLSPCDLSSTDLFPLQWGGRSKVIHLVGNPIVGPIRLYFVPIL